MQGRLPLPASSLPLLMRPHFPQRRVNESIHKSVQCHVHSTIIMHPALCLQSSKLLVLTRKTCHCFYNPGLKFVIPNSPFPFPFLSPPSTLSLPSPPSIPPSLHPPLPSPLPRPFHFLPSVLSALLSSFTAGRGRAQQGGCRAWGCLGFPSINVTQQPASAPLENHPPHSFPVVEVGRPPPTCTIRTQGLCPGRPRSVDGREASSHLLATCPGKLTKTLSYCGRKTSRGKRDIHFWYRNLSPRIQANPRPSSSG